jgi:hypothetical protein
VWGCHGVARKSAWSNHLSAAPPAAMPLPLTSQLPSYPTMAMANVAPAKSYVPRLLRNVFSQQVIPPLTTTSSSSCIAKKNVNPVTVVHNFSYSPHELLSQFQSSVKLTIKRSSKTHHRFFMYEEQSRYGDTYSDSSTVTVSPMELAELLQSNRSTSDYHYYWTSPIADVAPLSMMSKEFNWFNQLQTNRSLEFLDPRGPSLWMGTSGSGTQCHYDVADNIIVQLYGTKRIRIYPPIVGVSHLHVFPDAHPKARKSQVDFDFFSNSNDDNSAVVDADMLRRFPHFTTVPNPTMDVILQPGDALQIPAFWFHHVENGTLPRRYNSEDATICKGGDTFGYDDNHQPSVSLNSFALSESMIIARRIFQLASRPLGGKRAVSSPNFVPGDGSLENASNILRALGIALIRGLNVVNYDKEMGFIRTYLLEARYIPLLHRRIDSTTANHNTSCEQMRNSTNSRPSSLTSEQQHMVNVCIDRILPDFRLLELSCGEEEVAQHKSRGETSDANGIKLLVALHLLELWAVELVGPKLVAEAWELALSS